MKYNSLKYINKHENDVLAEGDIMHIPDTLTLSKIGKILDSSKLNEFADDNFKFDENGRKYSKRECKEIAPIVTLKKFLLCLEFNIYVVTYAFMRSSTSSWRASSGISP